MTKVEDPPGPLWTERLSNGNRALLRDLVVTVESGDQITVPEGFVTDFSSIPWFGRSLIKWSRVDIAGVVHDYLYWCPQPGVPRLKADAIWREIAGAGEHRANYVQRQLGWLGLVLFGWWAYRNAQIETAKGNGRMREPNESA